MLNNKGQSLILFIIVLPILLFILILVIDVGKVIVLNQELNNISEIVLDYGLDKFIDGNINNNNKDNNIDSANLGNNILLEDSITNDIDINIDNYSLLEEDIVKLIDLNKNGIELVDVRIENNKIYIKLEDNVESVLSGLVNIDIFKIKSYYVGYIDSNNKKRIERISGD